MIPNISPQRAARILAIMFLKHIAGGTFDPYLKAIGKASRERYYKINRQPVVPGEPLRKLTLYNTYGNARVVRHFDFVRIYQRQPDGTWWESIRGNYPRLALAQKHYRESGKNEASWRLRGRWPHITYDNSVRILNDAVMIDDLGIDLNAPALRY